MHHEGLDELVCLTALIRPDDPRHRIVDGMTPTVHHGVEGELRSVPPSVAVHRVVSPHRRGDDTFRARSTVRRRRVDDLAHEVRRRLGRRIPPVEESVNGDPRHPMTAAQLQAPHQVFVDGVYAARADEAQQVERTVAFPHALAELHEFRDLVEGPRSDRLRDAHDVLRHDPAGTQVQMTDLTVPHLTGGEADGFTGGIEQGKGRVVDEAVPHGRPGERDGVAVRLRSVPPPVQHDQDHGSGYLPAPL